MDSPSHQTRSAANCLCLHCDGIACGWLGIGYLVVALRLHWGSHGTEHGTIKICTGQHPDCVQCHCMWGWQMTVPVSCTDILSSHSFPSSPMHQTGQRSHPVPDNHTPFARGLRVRYYSTATRWETTPDLMQTLSLRTSHPHPLPSSRNTAVWLLLYCCRLLH